MENSPVHSTPVVLHTWTIIFMVNSWISPGEFSKLFRSTAGVYSGWSTFGMHIVQTAFETKVWKLSHALLPVCMSFAPKLTFTQKPPMKWKKRQPYAKSTKLRFLFSKAQKNNSSTADLKITPTFKNSTVSHRKIFNMPRIIGPFNRGQWKTIPYSLPPHYLYVTLSRSGIEDVLHPNQLPVKEEQNDVPGDDKRAGQILHANVQAFNIPLHVSDRWGANPLVPTFFCSTSTGLFDRKIYKKTDQVSKELKQNLKIILGTFFVIFGQPGDWSTDWRIRL